MLTDLVVEFAPAVAGAAAVAGVLSYMVNRVKEKRKTQKLGGWAFQVKTHPLCFGEFLEC